MVFQGYALYPPSRRILLPARYTMCGGESLVEAFDYLAGVVARLAARGSRDESQ
jgi:hypothetical protein